MILDISSVIEYMIIHRSHVVDLYCRMILETDPTIIAGKVATHTMDADAPLAEQVMQNFPFA